MPQRDPISVIQDFFEHILDSTRRLVGLERRMSRTETLLHRLVERFDRQETVRVVAQRADELRFIGLMRRLRVLEGRNIQVTDMESIGEASERGSEEDEGAGEESGNEEGASEEGGNERGSSEEGVSDGGGEGNCQQGGEGDSREAIIAIKLQGD
ncbi:hypothetical protein GQ53DRAFT_807452 [Thozetella sp. PMI_491]|nr:hypothetical protein GQ53DRAFT_807452 [Thozetella sp. PMI_491]